MMRLSRPLRGIPRWDKKEQAADDGSGTRRCPSAKRPATHSAPDELRRTPLLRGSVHKGVLLDLPADPAQGGDKRKVGTTYQEREKNRKKAMP